jgi:hypothetical protein
MTVAEGAPAAVADALAESIAYRIRSRFVTAGAADVRRPILGWL